MYSRPPGTDGIPNLTIESTKYNTNVADVEQDLNTPRPVVAGGTGATTARDALIALGGEQTRQLVDNYDMFPFVSGSFYSGPGATAAPNSSDFFEGICYTTNPVLPDFYLEARSLTTDVKYLRRKGSGSWSVWVRDDQAVVDLGNSKVAKAGDTMTGALHISDTTATATPTTGALTIVGGLGVAGDVQIGGYLAARSSYCYLGGDTAQRPPADLSLAIGANYTVGWHEVDFWNTATTATMSFVFKQMSTPTAHTDLLFMSAGAVDVRLTTPATSPSSAALVVRGGAGVVGDIQAGGIVSGAAGVQAINGTYYFQDAGKTLTWNTGIGGFLFSGGYLQVNSNFVTTGTATIQGAIVGSTTVTSNGVLTVKGGGIQNQAPAGADVTYNLMDDTGAYKGAVNWQRNNNSVNLINATAGAQLVLDNTGKVFLAKAMAGRAGTAGAYDANAHNFFWTGSAAQVWIDTNNVGTLTIACDYRIKKDIEPLRSTWEVVKRLRPIVYTQAEYTPPGAEQPLFTNDDTWRWGFVAHELQETLLPSAASGTKDAPDEIQSPNLLAIVAALTRALQESMERIEALEAARAR